MVALAQSESMGDQLHRLHTTFGGVVSAQIWADYYLWELVLNDQPDVHAIVEIGTWQGGFSRYLYAQAQLRHLHFLTYDVIQPTEPPPSFVQMDVFRHADAIREQLAATEPLILLCDGGNKPRELREFGAALHAGSLVVVHDWLTEVGPGNVPPNLEMTYEDACTALGSMSRVFKAREEH